jgi:NAD-dependent SIR2 family protein deacetylase
VETHEIETVRCRYCYKEFPKEDMTFFDSYPCCNECAEEMQQERERERLNKQTLSFDWLGFMNYLNPIIITQK